MDSAAEHVQIHVHIQLCSYSIVVCVCACLQYIYMYVYVIAMVHVFIVVVHLHVHVQCIQNILSLVCVSDLPTHYVHEMASCGDDRVCHRAGGLCSELWDREAAATEA